MSFFKRHFGDAHVRVHATFGLLVEFSRFQEVLKTSSLPTDTIKYKKANVERTVNGYKNGIIVLEDGELASNKQWIRSEGILKYIFKHNSEIALCSALANEVDSITCRPNQDSAEDQELIRQKDNPGSLKTILDLYRLVSNLSFREDELQGFFINFFQVKQKDLPTLYLVHRPFFSEDEWKKIMYFEHHFSLTYGADPRKTVDEELEVRKKYLRVLTQTIDLQEELFAINKKAIQERNMRKESNETSLHAQLKGYFIHRYDCLDKQLQDEVTKYSLPVGDIVTIPSPHSNHVSVCSDMNGASSGSISDIYSILAALLMKKHTLGLDTMFVISSGTFKCYYRKELKRYARFILHDDIVNNKVRPCAAHTKDTTVECDIRSEEDKKTPDKCESCFHSSFPKPLEINNFTLLEEWVMDVPLIIQLLLESSISFRYFKESTDKQRFLQPKIMKLYLIYDTMLNNLNHKYTGLLQQANTLELIMHSKCLTTVFQVAANSGIAMSLSSAARYLENNTVDDLLYYNTYLKGQPLTYKHKGNNITADISLRDCITILMVDNLVRLKYRDDPNPGEHRSKQMNTLPITIQGIPLDSDEVASWHLQTCDGSTQCFCKEAIEIPAENLVPFMVTLLPNEEVAQRKFTNLCTWGYPGLWKQLIKGIPIFIIQRESSHMNGLWQMVKLLRAK